MLYTYDKHYFDKIDSPEKAYWIGFIMADGYVYDNRSKPNKSNAYGIRIRLHEKDHEHLEKLNECMNGNIPIRIVKNHGVYENCSNLSEFNITNKVIMESMYRMEMVGKKSTKEFIPKEIEDSPFVASFLLGLFDGDGSLYKNKNLVEWSMFSSRDLVLFAKNYFEKELGVTFQKIDVNNNCDKLFRLRTGSRKTIIKIMDHLYSSTNIFLKRKKEFYQDNILPS